VREPPTAAAPRRRELSVQRSCSVFRERPSELLDPDTTNNDASSTATVLTPADLAIAIGDAPDPVAAAGTLSYTITVTNTGPGPPSPA
jgi:hypothetical protein